MIKSTKPGIKRFPYYLADMFWRRSDKFSLVIHSPDASDEAEYEPPLGLPIDIAYFVFMHCQCAFCGAPISRDLSRCTCGKPDNAEAHLEVECAGGLFDTVLKPILAREDSRVKGYRRRQMVKDNGGTYTQKDLDILYQLQESLCYFCGQPFAEHTHGRPYHADHYVPICDGGKNDVSNLVLTCPSCNFHKNAMDGNSFDRIARKTRPPEIGRKLGRIRKKVNAFRAAHRDPDAY